VPSSVIRGFAYDAPARTLVVTFTSGRRYRYHEVPPETHEAMRGAFAKGEFFNRHIRDRFPYTAEG
jgi:lysyl-tRNA synthetase class 2